MATDVPVLASRIAALEEVYGDAALFVDPHQTADIARGLERLSDDAALREDLRTRGAIHSRRFSWRKTAEATREIYIECLNERQ